MQTLTKQIQSPLRNAESINTFLTLHIDEYTHLAFQYTVKHTKAPSDQYAHLANPFAACKRAGLANTSITPIGSDLLLDSTLPPFSLRGSLSPEIMNTRSMWVADINSTLTIFLSVKWGLRDREVTYS